MDWRKQEKSYSNAGTVSRTLPQQYWIKVWRIVTAAHIVSKGNSREQ